MIKYGFSIILFLLLSASPAIAQRFIGLPFAGYDEEATLQVGFQYNYVNQNYQLVLKKNWRELVGQGGGLINLPADGVDETVNSTGRIHYIHSRPGHGFAIGIPIDMRWNEVLSINFTPSFNILNSHQIVYSPQDASLDAVVLKSKHVLQSNRGDNFNSFEFPVALKLLSGEKKLSKSDTRYRAYVLAGARLTRWTGIQKAYTQLKLDVEAGQPIPEAIILRPEYMSLEAGVGMDFITSYFRVSPEVRFSQSMSNVLSNRHILAINNKFMAPIDRGLIRTVYFSLIFQ